MLRPGPGALCAHASMAILLLLSGDRPSLPLSREHTDTRDPMKTVISPGCLTFPAAGRHQGWLDSHPGPQPRQHLGQEVRRRVWGSHHIGGSRPRCRAEEMSCRR